MTSGENSSINATDSADTTEGSAWGSGLEDGEDFDEETASFAAWEIVVFLVMALLIVVVNMFVVLLITRKRSLRTATNLIFVSLAVSDLLMGVLGIPLVMFAVSLARNIPEVNTSSFVFIKFISFSTMGHILLHTCDRYVYILCALRYEQLMYSRRVYTLLTMTWITTLLASSIKLTWIIGVDFENDDEYYAMEEKESIYNICSFTIFFCLPLAAITAMDIHMLCIVHQQSKSISQQNLPTGQRQQTTKLLVARKRKAVLTCIIILVVYLLCWLPYSVLEWLSNVPRSLMWVIYYIRFMSSVCNPWLYTLRKPDLRKATLRWYRQTFPCLRNRHRRQQQRSMRSSTQDTTKTGLVEESSPV